MLGMMNGSDNLEFYASSPSSKRLFEGVGEDADGRRKSNSDILEVFSEVKERVHISYTEDGRKLINGKLLPSEVEEPEKMWNRLIVNTFAGRLRAKSTQEIVAEKSVGIGRRSSEALGMAASSSSSCAQRQSLELPKANRSASMKPVSPIFVHSSNPRFLQMLKIEPEGASSLHNEQSQTKVMTTSKTSQYSYNNVNK